MNHEVLALMGEQHGLVLRRQVLASGVAPHVVDRVVHTGEWVAVRRGVYTTSLLWEALDDYVGRPRLRAIAASMNMRHAHVLSHDSAALLHDMPILAVKPEVVHVTRPGVDGNRTHRGVRHHPAAYRPDEVAHVGGLPVFNLARTAVDIAREHGSRHGLVACDSARRMGVTLPELRAAVAPMASWPYVTVVRWCVEMSDPRAENVAESLTRHLALRLGLGEVDVQFGLTDGRRQVWCDLRIGRHIIEFDGRLKYRRPSDGGIADDPDRALWEEKLRQDFISGFKLGFSRVTWVDLQPRNLEATAARVRREAVDTRARFGESIDDLAPYIISRPPHRPAA